MLGVRLRHAWLALLLVAACSLHTSLGASHSRRPAPAAAAAASTAEAAAAAPGGPDEQYGAEAEQWLEEQLQGAAERSEAAAAAPIDGDAGSTDADDSSNAADSSSSSSSRHSSSDNSDSSSSSSATPSAASLAGAAGGSSGCPAWLDEYAAFHRRTRGAPGARYLLAVAPHGLGLGDRLRGLLYALRIAAGSRRVLLAAWPSPGNLTDFFAPPGPIDWRLDEEVSGDGPRPPALPSALRELWQGWRDGSISDKAPVDWADAYYGGHLKARNYSGMDALSDKQLLLVQSNLNMHSRCDPCPAMSSNHGRDAVCMMRAMFTIVPRVTAKADAQLAALYPGGLVAREAGYVAVHVRLGHMEGEMRGIKRDDHESLDMVLQAVTCGHALAAARGVNTSATPVLLLTDHREVRRFAAHGKLARVVTPRYDAFHVATTYGKSLEEHDSTFVDLQLLAGARCLISGHSGFTTAAWLLGGGKECNMHLNACWQHCKLAPDSAWCNRRRRRRKGL